MQISRLTALEILTLWAWCGTWASVFLAEQVILMKVDVGVDLEEDRNVGSRDGAKKGYREAGKASQIW